MDKKKKMAGKMESKTYSTTRCGHCGKFGHHHDSHKEQDEANDLYVFARTGITPSKFNKK